MKRRSSGLCYILFLAFLLALHFYLGTLQITQTNRNRAASDQQHNMQLARESLLDPLPSRTSGVVNPLWPWLSGKLLLLGDPDLADEAFFTRGKFLNLTLTGIALAGAGLALGWWLGFLPAVLLLMLAALGALTERAPYFQPEPLYYMLFAAGFFLAGLLLVDNRRLSLFPLLGAVAGLAYLAKSAVTPMLAVFLGVSVLAAVITLAGRAPFVGRHQVQQFRGAWSPWRHIGGCVLLAVTFAIVILPRALHSQRVFGDPLHSFPKYWMWQDSFGEESTPFMQEFQERRERARAGDSSALPGPLNYWKTHTPEQVWDRLSTGFVSATSRFFLPEKRFKRHDEPKPWKHVLRYRGIYLGGAALLAVALLVPVLWVGRKRDLRAAGLRGFLVTLFVTGAFLLYAAAFGWYEVIGKGDRFMLSLYIPLSGFLIWSCERLRARLAHPFGDGLAVAIYLLLGVLLLHRINQILAYPWFAG